MFGRCSYDRGNIVDAKKSWETSGSHVRVPLTSTLWPGLPIYTGSRFSQLYSVSNFCSVQNLCIVSRWDPGNSRLPKPRWSSQAAKKSQDLHTSQVKQLRQDINQVSAEAKATHTCDCCWSGTQEQEAKTVAVRS